MFGLSILEASLLLVVVWLWITGGIFVVWAWGQYHGQEPDRATGVVIFAVWPVVVFWASFGEGEKRTDQPPF